MPDEMPVFSTTVYATSPRKEPVNYGLTLEQRLTPSIAGFQALKDDIQQTLRVALPAVVTKFTPGPPALVDVIVAMQERFKRNEPLPSAPDEINLVSTPMELPPLNDVPVAFPNGGGYSVTFPIAAGDEVLLVFSDTALGIWLQNGAAVVNGVVQTVNPIHEWRHILSHAIAIPGLRSTPRGIPSISTSSMQIRTDSGDTLIDIVEGTVTVKAPTVTVNAQTANIDGSTQVNINSSGSTPVNINGHNFLSHEHTGVQAGGSQTGGVATLP